MDFSRAEMEMLRAAPLEGPLRVYHLDSPSDSLFLRQVCRPITRIKGNEDLHLLVQRLEQTLRAEDGIGIAANQVGIGVNVFLFLRVDQEDAPVQVVINPRVLAFAEEYICFKDDGCLSVPNRRGDTRRHAWIDVEYKDLSDVLRRERLFARDFPDICGVIFQHEYDHLQGKFFTDRLIKENI